MSKYRIYLDGKVYEMRVECVDDNTALNRTLAEAAPTSVAENRSAVKVSPSSTTNNVNGGTVRCPMPGTVITVLKKPGDTVKAGEVVIILEAMKMENEICATISGTVQAIYCTEKQPVSAEDVLFEIG